MFKFVLGNFYNVGLKIMNLFSNLRFGGYEKGTEAFFFQFWMGNWEN